MIQRIQTFFLFDIIVLGIIILFLPLFHFPLALQLSNGTTAFGTDGKELPLFTGMLGIVMLLALVAIFMFKNRKRQMRFCMGGMIVSLLLSVQVVLYPQFYIHVTEAGKTVPVISPAIGAYLLFAIPVLFFLANLYVKKDEKLVRSADRLR